jgi:ribosomal protein S18 acetylase RimI-like enzyme
MNAAIDRDPVAHSGRDAMGGSASSLNHPLTSTPNAESPGNYGAHIEIRHLDHGDVDVMARLFEGLSAQHRYFRFLTPMPRFPRRLVRALADADGVHNVVLIAFQEDRPIGEGRFHRVTRESDDADLAVAVVSDQQQRGVGRALVAALAVEAERRGVSRFTFDVSPENAVVLSLLRRWGARVRLADRLVSGDVTVQAILTAECLDTTTLNGAPAVETTHARTLTCPAFYSEDADVGAHQPTVVDGRFDPITAFRQVRPRGPSATLRGQSQRTTGLRVGQGGRVRAFPPTAERQTE